jgi:hypothetical protein
MASTESDLPTTAPQVAPGHPVTARVQVTSTVPGREFNNKINYVKTAWPADFSFGYSRVRSQRRGNQNIRDLASLGQRLGQSMGRGMGHAGSQRHIERSLNLARCLEQPCQSINPANAPAAS